MSTFFQRAAVTGSMRILAATGAAIALAGFASAQGTDAGRTVSNTFTLDYSVNGTGQPPITNDGVGGNDDPTVFTVDRLIDVTVLSTGGTVADPLARAPGTLAADTILTYTVTNSGNDRQGYSFSIEDLTADFSLVPASVVISYAIPALPAVPANGATPAISAQPAATGTLTPVAVGTASAGAQFTPDIPPGVTFTVTIAGDIPTTATNAQLEDLALVAETRDPVLWAFEGATSSGGDLTTGVNFEGATGTTNTLEGVAQNVFSDGAGTGVDVAVNGRHADTGRIVIATPNLTGVKTVGVISTDGANCGDFTGAPSNTQFAVPGACVEYIITVTNLGANDPGGSPIPGDNIPATSVVISDILPAELSFVASTVEDFAVPPTVATGALPAAPGSPVSCDGLVGTCLVRYEGGTVTAPGNTGIPIGSGATPTIARVRIHALVK